MPQRRLSHLALTALGVGIVIALLLYFVYDVARPKAHAGAAGAAPGVNQAIAALAGEPAATGAFARLSMSEQAALYPLQADWDRLGSARQSKWLEIADRFPSMTQDERERTQQRMREWVTLTPEQRRVARDSYLRAHALPPEKRAELLHKYQELPDQEKEHLAASAREHHSVVAIKAVRGKDEPLPTKAQIREGSEQRVPGVNLAAVNGKAVPAAPAPGAVSVAPAPSSAAQAIPAPAAGVTTLTAPTGAASAPATSAPGAATAVLPATPASATPGATPALAPGANPATASGQIAPAAHP